MTDKNSHQDQSSQLNLLDFSSESLSSKSSLKSFTKMNFSERASNEEVSEIKSVSPEMLLILDTETTGLDPVNNACVEIGAILFNVPSRAVISQISFLMPVQTNEAEIINKIPAEITRLNQPWKKALDYFNSLLDFSEVVVAHNAAFDRQWFGIGFLPEIDKKWICTMEDISWPSDRQLGSIPSVRDLSLAYGVPVWNAHRALTDCIYLAEVFKRCENLETLLSIGLEPRKLFRAQVSYDQRHLAKEAGFRWNSAVKGAWTRKLSEREILNLDFSVVPVDNDSESKAS